MSDEETFPEQFDRNGTPACPTCGRAFERIGTMRAHHSRMHGDRLPNRRCEGCDSTFYDPKGELKFCDSCNAFAGEHNGNWRDAKEVGECIVCGEEFSYYPSEKPGKFCAECYRDPEVSGNPPQEWWGEGSRTVECAYCEAEFTVYRWKAENQDVFFCGRDCYARWLSEERGPEAAPRNAYGLYWQSARKQTLERDEFTCQRCGVTEEELGESLHVHHILPVKIFNEPHKAHTLDNLISLCSSCHRKVEWYDGDI